MSLVLEVEADRYDDAANALVGANRAAAQACEILRARLSGYRALGGDDTSSEHFVASYDDAAAEACAALAALVGGLAALASVTRACGHRHRAADAASLIGRNATVAETRVSTDDCRTVSPWRPPTALGGDASDLPAWWNHVVDHLQGWGWPSADTDQLRDAADAWRAAARSVETLPDELAVATSFLKHQRSPEIDTALAVIRRTGGQVEDLAAALWTLGGACDDYADQVEQTRETIRGLLEQLALECGITAGTSLALSVVTLGASAAAGAAIVTARAIRYAYRIIDALRLLRDARAVLRTSQVLADMTRLRRALERLKVAHRLVTMERISAPQMTSTLGQLEKKFKHAKALGVELERGREGFAAFGDAVRAVLANPATITREGIYRGQAVTISFELRTGRCVVLGVRGDFVSAWKLGEEQLRCIIHTGKLGGGA